MFVFPGANHTRFEHSLGTYDLSLRYLERLLRVPDFRDLCDSIEEAVKIMVLSALLHDIGHYPYSHWVEEIGSFSRGGHFPSHERRAADIIQSGPIRSLIESEWGVDVQAVCNIIADTPSGSQQELLRSIINSFLDVDKLDYLIRDSIHCGVDYGKGIDRERILDSLYVDKEQRRVCLTHKGRSCVQSILACRNIMYQEVYWHKTVRACHAMFKRFMYEYVARGVEDKKAVQEHFNYSDDEFTRTLHMNAKADEKLQALMNAFVFNGRKMYLYKPAYIYSQSSASKEPNEMQQFFREILSRNTTYAKMVQLSNHVAAILRSEIPSLDDLDILIDQTPTKDEHEVYGLRGMRTWNTKKMWFEEIPGGVENMNQYLACNRQAYLFCSPQHSPQVRKMVSSGKLTDIVKEALDEFRAAERTRSGSG